MPKNSNENLLLDTHILLWLLFGDRRLSENSLHLIERASRRRELVLSPITLWEIGYLVSKEKVQIKMDIQEFWHQAVAQLNATEIAVASADMLQYHKLPAEFHGDPGDRFLVSQAMHREYSFLTADEKILAIRDKLNPCRIMDNKGIGK